MSSVVGYIRELQTLRLPESSAAAALFERILQSLLEAEGPPPSPIEGISSPVKTAIARTPTGRPLYLCHAWTTADWTCVLLDLAPVVMGRPFFLKNPNGGPGRVVTDYRSQKFQRRLGAACTALGLPPMPEPSRVCSLLASTRLFVAWAPIIHYTPPAFTVEQRRANRDAKRADLDNYAKNVLDALQRVRIASNDRTIASLSFSRVNLPEPTETLDQHLLAHLIQVRTEHPKLNRRILAKRAGISQRECKRLLNLSNPALPTLPAASQSGSKPAPAPKEAARGPEIAPEGTSAALGGSNPPRDASSDPASPPIAENSQVPPAIPQPLASTPGQAASHPSKRPRRPARPRPRLVKPRAQRRRAQRTIATNQRDSSG